MLDHAAHHRRRHDAGERVERAVDRDHGAALRYRRELAEHRRADHIDRAAQAGADHEQRDQHARRALEIGQHREDRAADHQWRRAEHAAGAAGRHAARHQGLRDPAGEQHDRRSEHPGQNGDEAGLLLRVAEPLDDEGREPGEPQRQRPIGAEGRRDTADESARGEQLGIGDRRLGRSRGGGFKGPLLAHDKPRGGPHQPDHAERAERIMPAVIHDHPVQRRHRDDHAESRALRQDGGRQRPLLVGEPFIDRMRGDRERRPLAGAKDDAADQERDKADGTDHRKLRQRPDQGQHQ